jgi:SAM-dependent methyltransferase
MPVMLQDSPRAPSQAAWNYEQYKAYLLDIERPASERADHRVWVEGNLPRFLRTLDLIPPGVAGERCLEIGSIPYTFTLLMQKFRPYELTLLDFYGSGQRQHIETIRLPSFGETHHFISQLCDLEKETMPFADDSFDGVLCCEVLEHLTRDPVAMLAEIHRVLKPAGWLILTTPNVANLTSILDLLHGRNVYRPYDVVFGPPWRHNREYTEREVQDLLRGCGFAIEHFSAEEMHPPGAEPPWLQRAVKRVLRAYYGQSYAPQLYVRARRGEVFRPYYPPWLYDHVDLDRRFRASAG